jgi:lipopolysaccharide biosynthesis glycosyltransferase
MCERVIDECQRNVFRWTDQDAINKCCAGRILRFSGKYNYIPFFTELEEDVEPAIIHYADKNQGIRPWIYTRIKGADMWLDCARQVFDEEEFKKVLSDAEMITENWNNILRVCDEYETRYVWGLGEDGRYLVDALKFNKFKLRGIIESDVTKVGTTYQGVPVISADDVPDRSDVLVIISSWKCHEDILEAMKDKGIRNVRKEFFNRKRKPYYKLIDKKFYGVELRELLEQQGILEHVEGGAHGSETVGFLQ